MNTRKTLLVLACLILGGTLFFYIQEKPSSDVVFNTEANLISLSGTAISFSAPKGAKRIRVTTANGAEYYTDCLAIPFVCADATGIQHPINFRGYKLSSNLVWPVSVNEQGRTVVTNQDSRRMYELYLEQERNMILRLGLSLAAVFIYFSIKMGVRQIPPSSAARFP